MPRRDATLSALTPHPDHFDATKYGPSGEKLGGPKGGRHSKITREQADRLAGLELVAKTAQRDLVEYLVELGYETPARQSQILLNLRKGWRPQR